VQTLTHKFKPRGAARELFSVRQSEVLLSGPAGTGKSRACLEKCHMLALMNPGCRGLIVRKTFTSLGSTALVTWREHVVKEALETGLVTWYGGSGQESAQYRYTNGSVIVVGGLDKATRIMSSEYDFIYVQEAIELTEADWEACTTRLRNGKISFQQMIADTNPDAETHWLNVRSNQGKTLMLQSKHTDNPVYFDDEGLPTDKGKAYIAKLDDLTGVRKLRLKEGLWVASEGIVYERWDQGVHLIDRFNIPRDWQRWWVVDFGFTNPFVLQMWAEDPDGRLYMYREIYRTKRLVEDHARDVLKLVTDSHGRWTESRPTAIICDHDAEDRATLEKHLGMSTEAAKKSVSDGIQAVESRLKVQEDGKARLYILRDACVQRDKALVESKKPSCTAEEIPAYVWADNGKEQPVKSDDHGCDAMRYIVAERDLGSRPNVRWL
jgi:PBSX family phage terminase large subunit